MPCTVWLMLAFLVATTFGATPLPDAKCSLESVQDANAEQLSSILTELMNCDRFRLFRVQMKRPCEFWKETEECTQTLPDLDSATCSLSNEPGHSSGTTFPWGPPTDQVDKTLTPQDQQKSTEQENCHDDDSSPTFWLNICGDIDTSSSEVINLQLNPERWTGYNGSNIWKAIYEENCFVRTGSQKDLCYEERVLYRLLSGMHSSIGIHITLEYYPPVKGKRTQWTPNPQRFVELYSGHPERLLNLHFAFVVILRSIQKAAPHFKEKLALDDPHASALFQHLLDTHLIKPCGTVFNAFDESLLFKDDPVETRSWARGLTMDGRLLSLKQQFKGVFRNISRILDCVSCQKCKLHAKVQLLGIGTALKILLSQNNETLKNTVRSITEQEFVALINTAGRWSNAIRNIQLFTKQFQEVFTAIQPLTNTPATVQVPKNDSELVDQGLSLVVQLAAKSLLTEQQEAILVDALLNRNPSTLLLVKHYHIDPSKFAAHALRNIHPLPLNENDYDAVVVGGGLAGLTTTIQLLDRGARVLLLEKERFFGGNSAWASSGINGIDPDHPSPGDSIEAYRADMVKASGIQDSPLIDIFVKNSGRALHWLRTRCNISLSEVGQLGGHSFPRTYRPTEGLAGATIMIALGRMLEKGSWGSLLSIIKQATAHRILEKDGVVEGIEYEHNGQIKTIKTASVVLATGGFASDFTATSLIQRFTPNLIGYATTNGKWATGDGHKLALAIGADTVGMENVQVHPTGFIDPANPDDPIKILCAEILRGVGGILLNAEGKRFCNELGTRDYVVEMMTKQSQKSPFTLLLNSKAAETANVHVPMYLRKGLLRNVSNIEELATILNVPATTLQSTFDSYNKASVSKDPFKKQVFNNVPINQPPYYVGQVAPVLHYCMGGIKINQNGAVLREDGSAFKGLYAAGEIIGGLHGKTRLGGNALTECVVFGSIVAESVPLGTQQNIQPLTQQNTQGPSQNQQQPPQPEEPSPKELKDYTKQELSKHKSREDCWVAINGLIYDFTDFLDDHPGGPDVILKIAGKDGTKAFLAVHPPWLLEDFEPIGKLIN